MSLMSVTLCLLCFAVNMFTHVEEVSQETQLLLDLADECRASTREMSKTARLYAATGDSVFKDRYNTIAAIRAGTQERPEDSLVAPNEKIPLITLLEAHGVTSEEYALLMQASSLSTKTMLYEEEAMNAIDGLFKDSKGQYTITGTPLHAVGMELVFGPLYRAESAKIAIPLNTFEELLKSRTKENIDHTREMLLLNLTAIAVCMILSFIAGIACYIIVRNRIIIPLGDTTQFAGNIAQGNLKEQIEVPRDDEIGILRTTLNTLVSNLYQKLQQVDKQIIEADKVANEASIVAQEARSVLEYVQSDTDHMHRISSTLEETMNALNSTAAEVSQSTSLAADISNQTKQKAMNGELVVNRLIDSIHSVYENSNTMKTDIKDLLGHAHNVSSIMTVISDIADQTNLLALNAAIEAARAGEAGRGFAVVADEVRKLAEKTMASTTGVANAINSIQVSVANSTKQAEVTVQDVEQATTLASECGESLAEILAMADTSAAQVSAISTASEKQSVSTEDIANTIVEVNEVASSISVHMEEAARVNNTFSRQNDLLRSLIIELGNTHTEPAKKR